MALIIKSLICQYALQEKGEDHPFFTVDDDRRAWAEVDEEVYAAALLYAGPEPDVDYVEETWNGQGRWYANIDHIDKHTAWQNSVADVIMQRKFSKHWWYLADEQRTPEYRKKARTIHARIEKAELARFYTWLCKQRGEKWTHDIQPT